MRAGESVAHARADPPGTRSRSPTPDPTERDAVQHLSRAERAAVHHVLLDDHAAGGRQHRHRLARAPRARPGRRAGWPARPSAAAARRAAAARSSWPIVMPACIESRPASPSAWRYSCCAAHQLGAVGGEQHLAAAHRRPGEVGRDPPHPARVLERHVHLPRLVVGHAPRAAQAAATDRARPIAAVRTPSDWRRAASSVITPGSVPAAALDSASAPAPVETGAVRRPRTARGQASRCRTRRP